MKTDVTAEKIKEQLLVISEKVKTNNHQVIRTQTQLLERIVNRFFDKSSYVRYLKNADEINKDIEENGFEFMGSTFETLNNNLQCVIDNMFAEIDLFGLPSNSDPKYDKSIVIHNNHNINQNQTFSYLNDVFKDSLTGRQYKEIVEIAKEEKDIKKAAPKIIDKIKGFGSDVASNIVANVLTNPALYNSLF